MSHITCRYCQMQCVPRLRTHGEDSLIFWPTTDHVCPFCGKVMYVTGGGFTPIVKVGFPLLVTVCASYAKEQKGAGIFTVLFYYLCLAYIFYKTGKFLYKLFKPGDAPNDLPKKSDD